MHRKGRRTINHNKKGKFDPTDTANVRHTKIGVWDLYEEKTGLENIPGSSWIESYWEALKTLPFVWRMIKDISSIRICSFYLSLYLVVQLVQALIPAVTLW